jgi:hypothetical protein
VPVTEDGADLDVTVDLVFTRAGRGLSIGLHLGVGAPFPSALRERLTATSAQRLAAGL